MDDGESEQRPYTRADGENTRLQYSEQLIWTDTSLLQEDHLHPSSFHS